MSPLPLFTRQVDDPAAHTPTIYDAHAATVNEMMDELEPIAAATPHARYVNVQTLSANKTLTDADYPIQSLDPNGANRDVTLPAAAAANHAYFFWNRAAATYSLVIKNAAAAVVAMIDPGTGGWVLPDGTNGWVQQGAGAPAWGSITGTLSNQADLAAAIREKLTGNRTYYVRTDGNDSNTGLANTAGGAFLTLQRAYNVIVANLDLAGYTVTVQVADGTYTGALAVSQPWTGGGAVTFTGNTGTPANVVINPDSNDCFGITCALPGRLTLQGFKTTGTTYSTGVSLSGPGRVDVGAWNFGATAGGGAHIQAIGPGTYIYMTAAYTVSGAAAYHYLAQDHGFIYDTNKTITGSGTFAFTDYALTTRLGSLIASGNTYTGGTITGARYSVNQNSVIYTGGGGANYFPGDSAGSAATGGQYS